MISSRAARSNKTDGMRHSHSPTSEDDGPIQITPAGDRPDAKPPADRQPLTKPVMVRARSWEAAPLASSSQNYPAELLIPARRPTPDPIVQASEEKVLSQSNQAKARHRRHRNASADRRSDQRRVDADHHWLSEDEGTTQVESYMRDHQRRRERGDLGSSSAATNRHPDDRSDRDPDGPPLVPPKHKIDAAEITRLEAHDIVEFERDADIISTGNNPLTTTGAERAGVIHHQLTGIVNLQAAPPEVPIAFEDLPDTQTLINILQRCLVCMACSKTLSHPTSLGCGHSLCMACFSPKVESPPLHVHTALLDPAASTKTSIQNGCRHLECQSAAKKAAPTQLLSQQIDVTLTKILALLKLADVPDSAGSVQDQLFPQENPPKGRSRSPTPRRDSNNSSETAEDPADTDTLKRNHKLKRDDQSKKMRYGPMLTSIETVDLIQDQEVLRNDQKGQVDEKSLALAVLAELECQVCVSLTTGPVTTRCGHTFCRKCMARSLDHNDKCPLCRSPLPTFAQSSTQPPNHTILSILTEGFGKIYEDRLESIAKEEALLALDMPIFVCTLAFPKTPTFLHVFEPRYRLMIRRAMDRDRRFGMVLPSQDSGGIHSYGTVLEIKHMELLPGGRSMIETVGVQRFKLVRTGTLDGYTVAKVEIIDDIPPEEERELEIASLASYQLALVERAARIAMGEEPGPEVEEELSTDALMAKCYGFLDMLRSGAAPWLKQKLNDTLGPLPEDPAEFSFYVAAVIPIYEYEKAKLLPITSPRLRLRLLVHWIEQLSGSWWFNRGCSLM